MEILLTTTEVDIALKYPTGRTSRLIRQGKITAVRLPDGSVRVKESELRRILDNTGGNDGQ